MPGEELIRLLDDLRISLNKSGVERTQGIKIAMGNNCAYYRKSLDLFLDKDYNNISKLVRKIYKELP